MQYASTRIGTVSETNKCLLASAADDHRGCSAIAWERASINLQPQTAGNSQMKLPPFLVTKGTWVWFHPSFFCMKATVNFLPATSKSQVSNKQSCNQ